MEFGFNLTKIIHSCTIWKWILQAFNRWHCINNTLYITLTYVKIDFVLSREIRYAQKPYQLSIKRTVVRRMQTRRAERWTTHTYCSCYRSALVWGGMVNTRTLTVHAGTATCWPLAGRPLLPSYPLASPDRDSGSDHGSESNHTPVDHENNLIVRLILTYGSGGSPVYIPIPCLFSH